MKLEFTQTQSIIKDRPNAALWRLAQSHSSDLRTHFYGENLEAKLQTIDGFEKAAMRKERVKYAKSNKDLFARLSRPIDKVFTARGGSVYYNMSDSLDKSATVLATDVRDGLSAKKWMETHWKPHFLDDPMGMIFIEIGADGIPYPTYKSSSCVFEGLPKGVLLDYVVFTVDKAEKKKAGINEAWTVYRVVDDLFDAYVRFEDGVVTPMINHTYPNYFGVVPAILNSDIADPQCQNNYLSMFNDVIDLANHFLLKHSIKVTHDFLHGFPKYWEYADDCPKCNGTKFFESKDCPDCKGTGKKLTTKVSDIKLMNYPESKETPIITPNVAGYVEPSKTYYELATDDLEVLEDAMTFTLWGTHRKAAPQGQDNSQPVTATQAFIDVQPVNERLMMISDSGEKRQKFMLDLMIDLMLKIGYYDQGGCSINYGRRYMIEGPDVIWQRYVDARQKAPISVLDDLLIEFYEAKYNSDPLAMTIKIKLMSVEPLIHNTVAEINNWPIAQIDKLCKYYFSEWIKTVSKSDLIVKTSKELKDLLLVFATEKQHLIPEPKPITVPEPSVN